MDRVRQTASTGAPTIRTTRADRGRFLRAAREPRSARAARRSGSASDIGGSIRIPALFCGVFGHKPSPGLVPNTGMWPPTHRRGRADASGRPADAPGGGPDAAAPDHRRVRTRIDPMAASDGARRSGSVSLDGLRVVTVEDSSSPADQSRAARRPRARRRGAASRPAPGSHGCRCPRGAARRCRSWPTLQSDSRALDDATRVAAEAGRGRPSMAEPAAARGGPHTLPTRITLAPELHPARPARGRTERLLARARSAGRRAGRRDRRRRPAASGASRGRAPARTHARAAVAADADRGLQPRRRAGHRGAARALRSAACRWASRSRRDATGPRLDRGRARARARVRRLGAPSRPLSAVA